MKTTKRADGWWIAGLPSYRVDGEMFTDYGPYKTRDEADADMAGLTRFYRDHPEYAAGTVPTPDPVPEPVADTPSPRKAANLPPTETSNDRQRRATTLTQRTLFGAER